MGKSLPCLICRRTEIRFQGFMIWRTGDQRREEVVVAGLACPGPDLISGTGNLTDGRDVSVSSLSAQRLANLTERLLDRVKPGRDVAPRVFGVSRHKVENCANFLCLAS
jgi:hypothetical protein